MDGRTLMEIMQSPNFSMWGPAEQAFKTGQQKQQADLATTLGLEQRNQAMHPLEMEKARQAARMSGGQADIYADQLARKIPAEDERKAALQKAIAGMDDTSRAQMKAQVVRNMQLAAMMEKNGGQLPQGFNLSPEEMQIFQPKNLKSIIAHGQAFMEMDPEWLAARKKAQEAQALENTRASNRVELKTTPSPGKDTPSVELPKTYGEVVAAMAKYKRASEKIAYLKSVLPGLPEQLQLALLPSYAALKKQADAEANARLAGEVDVAGATKGKVPVNPAVDLGDAPSAVTNRPQRQAPQISQADLKFTAKKHGITVEEVKKRLGIK